MGDRDSTTTRMRAITDDMVKALGKKAHPGKSEFWGWATAAVTGVVAVHSKMADQKIIMAQEEFKMELLEQVAECVTRLGLGG